MAVWKILLMYFLQTASLRPHQLDWSSADMAEKEGDGANSSECPSEFSWCVGSTMFQTQLKPNQGPEKHINVSQSNGGAHVAEASLQGPLLQGLS